MDVKKILTSDSLYMECLHRKQPDVPKRTAAETKVFFDSMTEKVLVPKINELVDASNKKANASDVYTTDEAHERFDHRRPCFIRSEDAYNAGAATTGFCFFEGSEETVKLFINISFELKNSFSKTHDSGSFTVYATVSKEEVTIVADYGDYGDCVRKYAIGEIISLRELVGINDDWCRFYIDWRGEETSTNYASDYAITLGQFELSDIHEYTYPKAEVYNKKEVETLHKVVTAPIVSETKIDGNLLFVSSSEELRASGEFAQYVDYDLFDALSPSGESVTAQLRLGSKFSIKGGKTQFIFPDDTSKKPILVDTFNGYKIISVTELGRRYISYAYPSIDEYMRCYVTPFLRRNEIEYATVEDEQTVVGRKLALVVFKPDSEGAIDIGICTPDNETIDELNISVDRPGEYYRITITSQGLNFSYRFENDGYTEVSLNIAKIYRSKGYDEIYVENASDYLGGTKFITSGVLPAEYMPNII